MNPDDLKAFCERQDAFNTQLMGKVDEMHRGLYGEKKNDTPGVIARLGMTEKNVTKLFNFKNRVLWIGSGVALGVSAVWKLVEALLK